MKKVFLNITALICGMIVISCSSDMEEPTHDNSVVIESTGIKVTSTENGSKDIATVKAIITNMLCLDTDACRIEYEVAASKFKSGGFELAFSAIVPDKYLVPIFVDEGFFVSDTQAKIGVVGLDAFNNDGNRVGYFHIANSENSWVAEYVYADRSFTMKGKTEYGLEVDYSFNKGWNIRYLSYDGAHYYTTQRPLNVDFKCYFPVPIRCGTY